MKRFMLSVPLTIMHMFLAGCGVGNNLDNTGNQMANERFSVKTKISDVIMEPDFKDFGNLIFPVDSRYYSGSTLGELNLTWYNNIDPDKTVEIANYLKDRVNAGDTVNTAKQTRLPMSA